MNSSIIKRLDPPAFLDDLTEEQKDVWSKESGKFFEDAIIGDPQVNNGPRKQIFQHRGCTTSNFE